ncbi:MAG: glucoamylase family protein [Ferruginibacter sp.]|nr:glucoamylase family protein [Ferruginibacter sp.]
MSSRQLLLVLLTLVSGSALAKEPLNNYSFFHNSRMTGHYFYTKVIGAANVNNIQDKLPVSELIFHTPGNSLQLAYTNQAGSQWQATIYRQQIRGQDHFSPANYLSFWVYKTSAATTSEDLPSVFLVGEDSLQVQNLSFDIKAQNVWTRVLLPIKLQDVSDPAKLIGVGFQQNNTNGKKHELYIDDIELVTNDTAPRTSLRPVISGAVGAMKHIDLRWPVIADPAIAFVKIYRATDSKTYKPVGIQFASINRYADFTGVTARKFSYRISFLNSRYEETALSKPVSASTRVMTDNELLTMVQEASFRYYWEGAEKLSGLAKENILGRHDMIASGASGFGIMALIVGTERKFITRDAAIKRFVQIVNFLENTETFHGAFAHFIDGPTGKAEPFFGSRDNGGDLVETSFLLQGLLTAKAYFSGAGAEEKMVRDKITAIWEKVEWNWYRQFPNSKFLYWHWSPDQGWTINHNLVGWNETMVTYLLAIASPTHPVPASMYYSGWANLDSTGRQYRAAWGGTQDGSGYANGNSYYGIKLDVGVSNGGPLFFTHYGYLGYDPHAITDKYTNYFTNNKNIASINYRYCQDNPGGYRGYGDSCWGLTASDGPFHYGANEPVLRQDPGIIAPTGAISSFPYLPEASMKALKNYYNNYGKFLWGEYGFRDAFSLTDNWCADIYMGLNQAPMTVMIENYRTGLLWKLFMSTPDIKNGLEKLAAETAKQR